MRRTTQATYIQTKKNIFNGIDAITYEKTPNNAASKESSW